MDSMIWVFSNWKRLTGSHHHGIRGDKVGGVSVLDDHVSRTTVASPHVLSGNGNLLSVDRADGLKTTWYATTGWHSDQVGTLGHAGTSCSVVKGDLRGHQISGYLDSLSVDLNGERTRSCSSGPEVPSGYNSCCSLDVHLIEPVRVDGSASNISVGHISGSSAGSVHHTGRDNNNRSFVLSHWGVGGLHAAIWVEQLEEREGPSTTGDTSWHESWGSHGGECWVWELVGRVLVGG